MAQAEANEATAGCRICGHGARPAVAFEKFAMPVYKCAACGVGWVEPDAFDPKDYYSEDFFEGGHRDGYAGYGGSEASARRHFRSNVALLRRLLGRGGGASRPKLLDVGCAYGYFLLEAEPFFDVHGLELSAHAVAQCHGRGLDKVVEGVVTAAYLAEFGPFDVITLFDVIEHLEDPAEVFQALAGALAPGGLLALTTGDWGSLVARISGSNWRLMMPPQHLWYFTKAALRALGRRQGLETVAAQHPWKVVPASLLRHHVQRLFGRVGDKGHDESLAWLGLPLNLFDLLRVIYRKK